MSLYLGDTLIAPNQHNSANQSLSNLNATGANIANWSTNVTNCITEIPQDIKLELNNGTLTLKAGSKVYVPNGAGVFDVVTINTDITLTQQWGQNIDCLLFVYGGSILNIMPINRCSSGASDSISGSDHFYYNTANNTLRCIESSGYIRNAPVSLPIAIVKMSGNGATVSSIQQIFNDFGYIGSTAFALPGVKGLIPNGRNADGSLKNIEYKNTIVRIRIFNWDISGSGQFFAVSTTGLASSGTNIPFYQQEEMPPVKPYTYWYKPSENIMYSTGSGTTWYKTDLVVVGRIVGDNTGKITSFTHKTVFHAVDWNDLEDKLNHLNNPFSLLDYKYSEYELSNASWLLSNGQWNSGAVYQSVYNLLLQIYNGTVTKAGVSVKLSTKAYADTDFVLNTTNTTFRLPLYTQRVLVKKKEPTDSDPTWYNLYSDGWCEQGGFISRTSQSANNVALLKEMADTNYTIIATPKGQAAGGNYDYQWVTYINVSTTGFTLTNGPFNGNVPASGMSWQACGYCNPPSVSEYTEIKGLYFYVGETVQDANIIAAGQALTDIADLKAHSIVETYVNGTSWYRLYSDKWCEQGGFISRTSQSANNVALLKEMADTNYTIIATPKGQAAGGNYDYQWVTYINVSTTGFTLTNGPFNGNVPALGMSWQACGYIS